MADDTDPDEETPKKGSKLPLIIGFVLLLVGGGAGFFAVQAGLIGGAAQDTAAAPEEKPDGPDLGGVVFVAIDPLVISLPNSGGRDHLRFSAQLEVDPNDVAEVEAIKPRIVDVLNGYLRAVELSELEDPTALIRLRGQMLRRVQVVAGEEKIKDLLIMEFVLS